MELIDPFYVVRSRRLLIRAILWSKISDGFNGHYLGPNYAWVAADSDHCTRTAQMTCLFVNESDPLSQTCKPHKQVSCNMICSLHKQRSCGEVLSWGHREASAVGWVATVQVNLLLTMFQSFCWRCQFLSHVQSQATQIGNSPWVRLTSSWSPQILG